MPVEPKAAFVVGNGPVLETDGHVPFAWLAGAMADQGLAVAAHRRWSEPGKPDEEHVSLETAVPGVALLACHHALSGPPVRLATRIAVAGLAGGAGAVLLERLGREFGGRLREAPGDDDVVRDLSPAMPVLDLGVVPVKDGCVRLTWRPLASGGELTALDPDGWRLAGSVIFSEVHAGVLSAADLYVQPGRRRKGVATAMYDAAEAMGWQVVPSDALDEDGALFWEARAARSAPAP